MGFEDDYAAFCQGKLADPYPLLGRLQAEDPVHWSPELGAWVITRYEDVMAAVLEPRLANDRVSVNMASLESPLHDRYAPLREHVSNWLGFTDPPRHTRMRQLVATTVNARLSSALRGRVVEIADDLLDGASRNPEVDLVHDFALPLPSLVICEILGVPPNCIGPFRGCCEDLVDFVGNVGPSVALSAERALASQQELEGLFVYLLQQKRSNPAGDLLTTLAAALDDGTLSRPECIGLCVFTYVAGFETTVSLIGNGIFLLLQHPEQARLIRADPANLASGVEEILRYESPIQLNTRLAIDDVKIGAGRVKAGDAVVLHIGAANRDPRRFEEPESFEVTRHGARNLSFGWAAHSCLGAPLARTEASIALDRLMGRFAPFPASVEMVDDVLCWREGMTIRALESLKVKTRGPSFAPAGHDPRLTGSQLPD
jgi:pimeloyl-[acyl-carrier protein] synthase